MVMTRTGGSDRRRLVKRSSSSKEKSFDQEGSAIYPISVEPLSSAPPTSLVPYGTSEDVIHAEEGFGKKQSYPLKNQNVKSSNLEDNPVQMPTQAVGPRENSHIEKHDSQDPNPNEFGVRTNTKPLPNAEEEEQHVSL